MTLVALGFLLAGVIVLAVAVWVWLSPPPATSEMEKLEAAFAELRAELGRALLPVLEPLARRIEAWADNGPRHRRRR